MNPAMFDGVTTAMITPFLSDGAVDYDGLRNNVRFQVENGVRGLLPLGTTGETPTLTSEEKERIVGVVVDEARAHGKDNPVMVGVGSNSTAATIENAKKAADWGADALLVVTPYYNKPSQAGIIEHFVAVANATDLPIVVYNIQGRSGVNIETETLKRIAEHERIIAVKEASGNINQMGDVISEIPSLRVYSGDDGLTLPLLSIGGLGVISVVSNLLPAPLVEMVNAGLSGNFKRAGELHYKLLPMFKAAFIESNPAPIKYAMSQSELAAGPLRLPLVEVTQASRDVLDSVMSNYTS